MPEFGAQSRLYGVCAVQICTLRERRDNEDAHLETKQSTYFTGFECSTGIQGLGPTAPLRSETLSTALRLKLRPRSSCRFTHVWTAFSSARRGTPISIDHGRELWAVVNTTSSDLAVYHIFLYASCRLRPSNMNRGRSWQHASARMLRSCRNTQPLASTADFPAESAHLHIWTGRSRATSATRPR